MLVTYKQKFLCINILILSVSLYTFDNSDNDKNKSISVVEYLTEKKKELESMQKITVSNIVQDGFNKAHKELLEQGSNLESLLDQVNNQSKYFLNQIINSKPIAYCRNELANSKENSSLDLRVDKIGSGTAIFGTTCILAANKFTNPGIIRRSVPFKIGLATSSSFLIYKLVAHNEVVKKDICNLLSKLKKD